MIATQRPTAPRVAVQAHARFTRQAQRRLLEVELAGQRYGIPLEHVQEVVPMAELSGPPNMPAVLAGLLNLEGLVYPVLRLDRLMRLPVRPAGLYTPLVVLRGLEGRLALMVERANRILHIADDAVLPLPENHSFNDCVEGMVADGDRVVLLLSPARLLLDKEQQCLAELQDREQMRLRELGESPS